MINNQIEFDIRSKSNSRLRINKDNIIKKDKNDNFQGCGWVDPVWTCAWSWLWGATLLLLTFELLSFHYCHITIVISLSYYCHIMRYKLTKLRSQVGLCITVLLVVGLWVRHAKCGQRSEVFKIFEISMQNMIRI